MTYQKSRWWILRPFDRFSKCQTKTFDEQLALGVRYFDFRVRFRFGKPYFCHGLSEYKGDLFKCLDKLKDQKYYVRIGFENIFGNRDWNKFQDLMKYVKENYPNIKFMFAKKMPKWENFENNFDIPLIELHRSPENLKEALMGPKNLLHFQEENYKKYYSRNSDVDVILDADFL